MSTSLRLGVFGKVSKFLNVPARRPDRPRAPRSPCRLHAPRVCAAQEKEGLLSFLTGLAVRTWSPARGREARTWQDAPHLATCRSVPHSGARPGPPSAAHSRTSVVVTEAVLRAAPSRGAGPRADGQLAAWAVGGPVFGVWGALLVRARARRGAADAGPPPPPALGRCSSGHWAASQSETRPCGSSKGPPASSVPSASSKSSQSEGATWSPAGFLGCGATACCNLITG